MPQVLMTLSTFSTCLDGSAIIPVTGFTPLLARQAPARARSRADTSIEHCLKYRSSARSGSPVSMS